MHKELERAQDAQMKTEQDSHVPRIDVEKVLSTSLTFFSCIEVLFCNVLAIC